MNRCFLEDRLLDPGETPENRLINESSVMIREGILTHQRAPEQNAPYT